MVEKHTSCYAFFLGHVVWLWMGCYVVQLESCLHTCRWRLTLSVCLAGPFESNLEKGKHISSYSHMVHGFDYFAYLCVQLSYWQQSVLTLPIIALSGSFNLWSWSDHVWSAWLWSMIEGNKLGILIMLARIREKRRGAIPSVIIVFIINASRSALFSVKSLELPKSLNHNKDNWEGFL